MAPKLKVNLSTFDLAKGLAMLNVFLVHTMWRYDMSQSLFLRLFSIPLALSNAIMPLFFLISGFGFKPKSCSKILKKTFSELIIPYFWVALAYALLYPVVNIVCGMHWYTACINAFQYVLAFLFGIPDYGRQILGYPVQDIAATWFMLATFISFNLLNLILKIKKPILQAFVVLLSMVMGYFLQKQGITYYCIPQGMMALGYSYLGYQCKKNKWLEKIWANPWTYVILIPIALADYKWGSFDLCNGHFNNVILDFIGAGAFGVLIILVGISIGKQEWKALDWLNQIGIHTYWLLCIHSFEMQAVPWIILVRAMPDNQSLALVIELVLKTIFITTACICLKKISKYNYRRRMNHRV